MDQLWSGFFGTTAGAFIGGIIAYFIAKFQYKKQADHFNQKEANYKNEKSIQLLWKIYFDIREDMVNHDIWKKREYLLNQQTNLRGTPFIDSLIDVIRELFIDIKELAVVIDQKKEVFLDNMNEFQLIWVRINRQRLFLKNLMSSIEQYTRQSSTSYLIYNEEIGTLYEKNKVLL